MDHAMDLALSAVDLGYPRPVIVSRPGSRAYVPQAVHETVEVVEKLPSLVSQDMGRLQRLASMVASLGREHIAIRRLSHGGGGPFTLVFQEPRYPWPGLFSWGRAGSSSTLILHNAVEHTGSAVTVSSRFQAWIRTRCLRRVTRVVTFGDAQARIARTATKRPVRSFVLPRSTRIVHDHVATAEKSRFPGLLCIGELRPNKGIEIAVEAAGRSGEMLHVVGRKVEEDYYDILADLAGQYPSVTLTAQFLSAAEFDQAVAAADCVLLPYVQFDAQSGVLAKASAFGVPVILSDLPSLREQVRDEDDAVLVAPGDVDALTQAVKSFRGREGTTSRDRVPDLDEWDRLLRACVTGW